MAATWAPWPRTTPPSSWTIVPPRWTPTPQFTSPLKSDSDIHVCQTGLFLYFDLSSGFGLFYIIFKVTKPRKVFALSTRTHRHTQPLHTSGYSLWVFFIWVFCPIYFRGGGWILAKCTEEPSCIASCQSSFSVKCEPPSQAYISFSLSLFVVWIKLTDRLLV